ncbi:GH92 family glycosyl hydrolase [Luteococcus peritonei]|uniref:GH92 family glycosyl hydrolase n=1 Tax=Luteococcus peritonei TaxID=88874 RepID=A0ABW4RQH9_9ACTN
MPSFHAPARLVRDDGPPAPPSSAPRSGLTDGPEVFRVDLGRPGVLPLGIHVEARAGHVVRLAIHPDLDGHDGFAATGAWPLALTADGPMALVDQHGHTGPGPVSCLVVQQWNVLDCPLDALTGRVELALDCPTGLGRLWLQVLGSRPAPEPVDDPVEAVRTTRGSHSGRGFSRGNTFPATCLPHGFTMLTPVTDARTRMWTYRWHGERSATPELQALAFSHQPSPWIKDRHQLQLMGWQGEPVTHPSRRGIGFSHDDEYDRPHHYRVRLADESVAEMVPADHGGLFRFSWPTAAGRRGAMVDIPRAGLLRSRRLADGRVEFWGRLESDPAGGNQFRAPVGFFAGRSRQPVRILRTRGLRTLVLEQADGEQLELEVATSFGSVDQAWHNLTLEVQGVGFDELATRAHRAWSELLERLELPDDPALRSTALTCLYRVHCWPSSMHENTGTAEQPRWVHASPFSRAPLPRPWRPGALWRTTSPVVEGRIFVNNGYWDTYRTAWPHLALFTPGLAGDLVDGLLAAWRESGWMGRWSAPGHNNCMVGTSSDVIFADAARHGLAFDEPAAYDSALRNASCPSPDPHMGRKGLQLARHLGWVPSEVDEAVGWSIENAVCDAALATWSADLAGRADELGLQGRREELLANARWLTNRALGLGLLFDPDSRMLRGRTRDGAWSREDFDPLDWGGDHTESSAWTGSVSMTHDGATLARLHGGPEGLAAHLDRLLATPETGRHPGHYPAGMHEIAEARALRMGHLALSNQPAHHIAWMYLHAGRPDRAQQVVRELLDRGFVGAEIGQGYPGDEDNGEMSAWWLFAAMGLYPLSPGSGQYVLGAPLAPMVWHGERGTLRVTTSGSGPFVAALRRNGEDWPHPVITLKELQGEVELAFELSEQPTDWGRERAPWSLTTDGPGRDWPSWRADRAGAAVWEPAVPDLVDDRALRAYRVEGPLLARWERPWRPRLLVFTVQQPGEVGLRVQVLVDGDWREVARRRLVVRWPQQSVAVELDEVATAQLRLALDRPVDLVQLEVV